MLNRLLQVLAKFRALRGFITVPGFISILGLVLAFLMLWLDLVADLYLDPGDLAWLSASPESGNLILSTVAGSAMAALSLVYSTVLVVFTLAAGTIAPRLLQRFSADRVSQVAVGLLGATFLYSLIVMRGLDEQSVPELSMTVAMLFAVMSVLMLLVFVNQAAKRVTVDEEIAAIARQLDEEIQEATSRGGSLDTDDLVWPAGSSFVLTARQSGYVDYVDHAAMSEKATPHQAFIDLDVMPGDYVMRGHKIARVLGARDTGLEEAVHKAIRLGSSRTPAGDLLFSVNLLVEIGLRALSPGLNDTYTAVTCIDRLSSSLMPLRESGIASGVHCDAQARPE
jgi:uncharacterized membrane protein